MRYISNLMPILACLYLWSCDVHEFPHPLNEDDNTSFVLHLDYDTNMPLYKTIEYTEDARSIGSSEYDIRYIVKVYPESSIDGADEYHQFVFTKNDVSVLNHSVTLNLKKGNYKFLVWSDYVTQGNQTDHLYNTQNFSNISLIGEEYQGNTDAKDAFRGTVVSEVSAEVTSARVQMERSVAKVHFISEDWENFFSQFIETYTAQTNADNTSSRATSIDDFKVLFRYKGYLPNTFNAHTNQSSGTFTEKAFESKLKQLEDKALDLGFDYLFAEPMGTSVNATVEICDKNGNILSSFTSIAVPLARGKLTVVDLKFLSSDSNDGAAIDPDYNGDHNIIF